MSTKEINTAISHYNTIINLLIIVFSEMAQVGNGKLVRLGVTAIAGRDSDAKKGYMYGREFIGNIISNAHDSTYGFSFLPGVLVGILTGAQQLDTVRNSMLGDMEIAADGAGNLDEFYEKMKQIARLRKLLNNIDLGAE